MTTEEFKLNALHRQALGVADAHSKFETAREGLRSARVSLLCDLISAITPALAAVADAVAISRTETPEGATSERAPWVGLRVNGNGPTLKSGVVGGRDLFLRPDGTFVALVYSGERKGLYARWTSMAWDLEPARVAREWDLSALCDAITEALKREAASKRDQRTARTIETTERLAALSCILRSWSL